MIKVLIDVSGVLCQTLFVYSMLVFVVVLLTILVIVFLLLFYVSSLGLGLIVTGYILLIGCIFDIVTDFLVGWLSDCYLIGGVRRKFWIVIGVVLVGVGLVRILNFFIEVLVGYLLGWFIVFYGGWTMVVVFLFDLGCRVD